MYIIPYRMYLSPCPCSPHSVLTPHKGVFSFAQNNINYVNWDGLVLAKVVSVLRYL